MKITLRKVTKTPLDFDIKSDEITFKGYLEYHSGKLILLKAKLQGALPLCCDICADEFMKDFDEEVEFFLSDGIYQDDDSMEYDVVEALTGTVNLEDVLSSEIELIRSDYHTCANCQDKDEFEF